MFGISLQLTLFTFAVFFATAALTDLVSGNSCFLKTKPSTLVFLFVF